MFFIVALLTKFSMGQILVESFDLKGNKEKVEFDSIITIPSKDLFDEVLPKLKMPNINTFYIEGTLFSVHVIYENKVIDSKIVRGIGMEEKEIPILKLQKKILKKIRPYLRLESEKFYLVYIPVRVIAHGDSKKSDTILLEECSKWGLKEVITIRKKRGSPR